MTLLLVRSLYFFLQYLQGFTYYVQRPVPVPQTPAAVGDLQEKVPVAQPVAKVKSPAAQLLGALQTVVLPISVLLGAMQDPVVTSTGVVWQTVSVNVPPYLVVIASPLIDTQALKVPPGTAFVISTQNVSVPLLPDRQSEQLKLIFDKSSQDEKPFNTTQFRCAFTAFLTVVSAAVLEASFV